MSKSKHQMPGRGRSAYEFMKAHRKQYSVQMMCRVLEVAPEAQVPAHRRRRDRACRFDVWQSVLESISGHQSRGMLEHYSHIRIDGKRQALDALDAARRTTAANGNSDRDSSKGNEDGPDEGRMTPSSRCPTSSRHSHVTVCG